MRETENKGSLLIGGVPAHRWHGRPTHLENDGDFAATAFRKDDGKINALHTPKDGVFESVHEIMHSRHSSMEHLNSAYAEVHDEVKQIVEDCRLHIKFWPWQNYDTPAAIRKATLAFMRKELKVADEACIEVPHMRGGWADFSIRLRYVAVMRGLDNKWLLPKARFATGQQDFANRILGMIRSSHERRAALELQIAFFPPPPELKVESTKGEALKGAKAKGDADKLEMEIIRLPLTEVIEAAQVGYRRASSGSRLHRPSLRKPVLPQKLFMKRTPNEPGGTILIDASGSMGSFDQVTQWCEKAPFGQIAYYAGRDFGKGWLYIYARDGRRARVPVEPEVKGNTVDGPAMDWLLKQPGPRIMVTDREFCGAKDSHAQVVRLQNLERQGLIKVLDYSK